MAGYTKLFSSIVHSTVWREEKHVKVLWVTMLALVNRKGVVEASLPGLADAARITLEECQDGLAKLTAPDPYSRTKDFEGRRIQECEGGWCVLNYPKYRDLLNSDQRREQVREAVQRHRAKRRSSGNHGVIGNQDVSDGKPPSSPSSATVTVSSETGEQKLPLVEQSSTALTALNGRKHPQRFDEIKTHLSLILAEVAAGRIHRLRLEQIRTIQAEVIFAYWQAECGHERALLDDKRLNRLKRCLKENDGNVHELLYAVKGWAKDPTFQRLAEQDGRKLDGIDNIFRDRERIERLAGQCKGYREGKPHAMAVKYLEGLVQ